ncbi:tetratricopeptide repeat protein [Fulvivirga sediminis]|uniref:Tetratricopeptide repeat protein n=1 Tax=Fulvivirga sediminis TaxID=2803949 RepID=A0A937F725_9BACT|nr:tetratricopeptide repeat protein [Fulvivirga sediminis]MBL3657632.1 tetratricopeptide repeat protein [Fulvivirga sediminis]
MLVDNMKKYLVLFMMLYCITFLYGQDVNVDSLKEALNSNLPDSTRFATLNELAWEGYLFTIPDSSCYYAKLHFSFAKQIGNKQQMATALNTLGTAYYMMGDYARASQEFYKSLKIKEDIHDIKGMAATLNNLGMINDSQDDFESATKNYQSAIDLINSLPDFQNNKVLKKVLVASYQNLAAVYANMEKHDLAFSYFNKTLELTEAHELPRERAYALSNIGQIYLTKDQPNKALEYYSKSYQIISQLHDQVGVTHALNDFAYAYYELKNYDSAISFGQRALKQAQNINSAIEIEDAAEILYKSYKQQSKYDDALTMLELYSSTKDSLESARNTEVVVNQRYKYQYEKQAAADSAAFAAQKEMHELLIFKQEEKLKSAKIQQFLLLSLLILLIILIAVSYKAYTRIKNRNNIIALQKKKSDQQRDKIAYQNQLLEEKNQEITKFNTNLELLIHQRTQELKASLKQISQYQHNLAHDIRAPYTTLVGLLNLFNDERTTHKQKEEIIEHLEKTTKSFSVVLKDISLQLNEFDKKIDDN